MEPEFTATIYVGDRVVKRKIFAGRRAHWEAHRYLSQAVYGRREGVIWDEQEFPVMSMIRSRGRLVTKLYGGWPA